MFLPLREERRNGSPASVLSEISGCGIAFFKFFEHTELQMTRSTKVAQLSSLAAKRILCEVSAVDPALGGRACRKSGVLQRFLRHSDVCSWQILVIGC